jgi:hypothetical protein
VTTKIIIEIDCEPESPTCGECERCSFPDTEFPSCREFGDLLVVDVEHRPVRCPQCREAEDRANEEWYSGLDPANEQRRSDMTKSKSKPKRKLWSYTYVLDGHPSTITYRERPVLELDTSLPSQYRQVLRVIRLLNAAERAAK